MAVQLQLAFNQADEKRNKLAVLKGELKDQLEGMPAYKKIADELEILNEKKKGIIAAVMGDNQKEVDEIEKLTADLKDQKQLISDVALNDFLAGKKVEVIRADGSILEPVFSVKFVKTDAIRTLTPEEKKLFKKNQPKIPERLGLE